MHEAKEKLPIALEGPGTALRAKGGWGMMSAAYAELPAGTDLRPLLKGLAHDACQCPHWGYVLKGSIHVHYTDDTEEVIRAGELFYLPPGHTAWLAEESSFVEFSPTQEYDEVLTHVLKQAAEMA